MKDYGTVLDVEVKDKGKSDSLVGCIVTVKFGVRWEIVPRLINALKGYPIRSLLDERVESEFYEQDGHLQCAACCTWFTVEDMPPRFCPTCGAEFSEVE